MKYLIIDTETSGLFNFKLPADAEGQPRMAQFGGIFLDAIDAEPRRVGMHIRPDGWEMQPGAQAVNGLSTEFLLENGVPVADVLDLYTRAIEDGYVIVAFNAQYDTKVMRAELRRAGREDLFEKTPNICVMRPMIAQGVVKADGKKGFPKLSDCCAHCGIEQTKEHDALGDAEGALGLLLWLHARDLLPEPAVHFAKDRA